MWVDDPHGFGVVRLPDGNIYLIAKAGGTNGHGPKTAADLRKWADKKSPVYGSSEDPHVEPDSRPRTCLAI